MKRHWKRILAGVVGAVALYAALGYLALPPLVRSQLEQRLSVELEREVRIERVRFDPFTLRATLEGLSVAGRGEGAPPLAGLRRLMVDVAWRSALERAPVIQRLELEEPSLQLAREADGTLDVDDLIAKWRARPAQPDAPTPRFAIANIRVVDGRFGFDDRKLSRVHEVTGLDLGVPFLSSLPVHQEVDVLPRLAARIDGAALGIEGRSRPFSEDHASALELSVGPVDLADYAAYLPSGLPVQLVSGVLSGEVEISFAQPEGAAPAVTVTGKAGVTGLGLRDPGGAPLLELASLEAEDLRLQPLVRNYAVGRLRLEAPKFAVHRVAGQPRFLERVLAAVERDAASVAAAPDRAEAALHWSVGEIQVERGEVDFRDDRFAPRALAVRAGELQVRVSGLGSDPSARAEYALSAVASQGERIEAAGTAVLAPLAVQGTASVGQIALKNWWWVAEPHLQADLLDGRLSVQTGYRFGPSAQGPAAVLEGVSGRLESLRLVQRWDRKDLLRLESLSLAEGRVDLLARRVEIGRIEGVAGYAAVVRDGTGRLNVDRLLSPPATGPAPAARSAAGPAAAAGSRSATTPAASSPSRPVSGAPEGAGWTLVLGRVALERWSGLFSDAAAGRDADLRLSQASLLAEGFDTAKGSRGKLGLKTRVGKAGSLAVNGEIGLQPLSGRLRIDADRIGVLPAQPWFTEQVAAIVTSGDFSAKGELRFEQQAHVPLKATWRGDASLSDFAAVTKAANEDLLSWKSLRATAVDFALDPLKIDIGEIGLSGFYSRLVISPEGRFNLQDLLVRGEGAAAGASAKSPVPPAASADASAAPAAPAAAAAPAGAARAEGLPVRIGRVILDDGRVYFTDNFIRPNHSADLTQLSGRVGTLSPETAGDVELRGRIRGTGSLEITGSVNPLAPSLFLDLRARAHDVDLPPISPYSVKYLGYGIEKGKLSADVSYQLRDRRLEARNKVVLDQLTFGERVESPTATKLPVLFAVSLLKDRNGVIDVEMPVGGSLDDPEFSVAGLVVRMIFNLIGKAVTAPFALLASLGGSSADLSHLGFPEGSARLGPETTDRLQALAKALDDRPALRLDLAGRADPVRDRQALRRLALERLVKAEKMRETVARGDASRTLDDIELSADEYPRYLQRAYRRSDVDKPRNAIGLPRDLPVAEMESLLLARIEPGEDALRELAGHRAGAVRDWLVARGIDADRLYVVAPKVDGEGAEAGRTGVDLSLK